MYVSTPAAARSCCDEKQPKSALYKCKSVSLSQTEWRICPLMPCRPSFDTAFVVVNKLFCGTLVHGTEQTVYVNATTYWNAVNFMNTIFECFFHNWIYMRPVYSANSNNNNNLIYNVNNIKEISNWRHRKQAQRPDWFWSFMPIELQDTFEWTFFDCVSNEAEVKIYHHYYILLFAFTACSVLLETRTDFN